MLPNLTHKEPIRFVGDLNPESILTDLSSRSQGGERISRVGTWVQHEKPPGDVLQVRFEDPPSAKTGEKNPGNVEKYGKGEGGRRTLTTTYRNYLQAVGAFRVLPKSTQDALITTYISCIDPLLPILDGGELLRQYTSGRASIFLIQAVCLITCKITEVAVYLRLFEDGPLLDPIPFARSLHTGLDAAMKADLEPDRVTKIRILTLMHLHNDGPGGLEEASLHLAQAIHDSWSAGLHIHTPGRTTKDQASMLWWTIWTLDRINACIGGRPIMIADRDIDIARPPCEGGPRLTALTVWIRLGDLLDRVINFYRPTASADITGWETEFPSFSSLLIGVDIEDLQQTHRSLLEVCYNVIAILSCRNASLSHASYQRRISSADRIEIILQNMGPGALGLTPIPLVPYAIGLSLTVAYRGLRDHHRDPDRAAEALTTRCEMLESLQSRWWTANAMARLGRKALKSLQNPVGVRRNDINDIANQMEHEVTICKYGPFNESKEKMEGGANGPQSNATPTKSLPSGNALHLLSDAAATHASQKSHQNQHQSQVAQLNHPPAADAPGSNTMSYSQTPMSDALPTPVPYAFGAEQGVPTPGPVDWDKFDNAFPSDLDDMFDGFFDLSMPTVLEGGAWDVSSYGNDTSYGEVVFRDGAKSSQAGGVGHGQGRAVHHDDGEVMDGARDGVGSEYPDLS